MSLFVRERFIKMKSEVHTSELIFQKTTFQKNGESCYVLKSINSKFCLVFIYKQILLFYYNKKVNNKISFYSLHKHLTDNVLINYNFDIIIDVI